MGGISVWHLLCLFGNLWFLGYLRHSIPGGRVKARADGCSDLAETLSTVCRHRRSHCRYCGSFQSCALYFAGALPKQRNGGTLASKENDMTHIVREFLKDEDRASRVLIEASVAIMAIGLVVAVSAIFLMK